MQFQAPPFAVTLRQKGPLGYTFKDFGNGAEVTGIKPGSQAQTAGRVVVGCTLSSIEVRGTVENVERAQYDEVIAALKRSERPVKLTFNWPPFYDPHQPAPPPPAADEPQPQPPPQPPPPDDAGPTGAATVMPAGLTPLQQLQWKKKHIRAEKTRLRAELRELRMRDLMRRAKSDGVDEEAVLEAQDSESPKDTMVELLLAHALTKVTTPQSDTTVTGQAAPNPVSDGAQAGLNQGAKEAQAVAGAKGARQQQAAELANERRRKKREAKRADPANGIGQTTAKDPSGTIIPMVDIGLVRATNPDLPITSAKVADVRDAIKQGNVQVHVGGAVQVAVPGDIDSLDHIAKERALEELAHNRQRVQEIMRTVSSPSPGADEEQTGSSPILGQERSPPARQPPVPGSAASKQKQNTTSPASAPEVPPKRKSQSRSPPERKPRKAKSPDSAATTTGRMHAIAGGVDTRKRAVTPVDNDLMAAAAAASEVASQMGRSSSIQDSADQKVSETKTKGKSKSVNSKVERRKKSKSSDGKKASRKREERKVHSGRVNATKDGESQESEAESQELNVLFSKVLEEAADKNANSMPVPALEPEPEPEPTSDPERGRQVDATSSAVFTTTPTPTVFPTISVEAIAQQIRDYGDENRIHALTAEAMVALASRRPRDPRAFLARCFSQGKVPEQSSQEQKSLGSWDDARPPFLVYFEPALAAVLRTAVARCLSFDPEERPDDPLSWIGRQLASASVRTTTHSGRMDSEN